MAQQVVLETINEVGKDIAKKSRRLSINVTGYKKLHQETINVKIK